MLSVSAYDVAAALRARQLGMPVKKLHKLLYYCQGHHLATFGEPLFVETIAAYDMGPVVTSLWFQEEQGQPPPTSTGLDEAQLGTVGYVLSRYGELSDTDLKHLTRSEPPWQLADATRVPGGRARIERVWMSDYFRGAGATRSDGVGPFDPRTVAELLAGAEARRGDERKPDSWADIRQLIQDGRRSTDRGLPAGRYHHAQHRYHEVMRQVITRVEDDLHAQLKEAAAARGVSVNAFVVDVLTAAVGPVTARAALRRRAEATGRRMIPAAPDDPPSWGEVVAAGEEAGTAVSEALAAERAGR